MGPKSDLSKDFHHITLLIFLYFLQCIPLGLIGSLPYILSSRKVSYADQGTFSFALWPFSLKLLWAPIVDSIFVRKIGRRKSWLIPIQYIIGFYMIFFADYIKNILDSEKTNTQSGNGSILTLAIIFFVLSFLASIQDICVDGWALTMLSKENSSWSSTCESVGGTLGWFTGNVLFLVVESADFSNKYIRTLLGLESQSYGFVTIDKFMAFFGMIFLIATTLVLIFKKEVDNSDELDQKTDYNLVDSYKVAWGILTLTPIRKLAFVLFTLRLIFATESMSFLKLIESGVSKETLGLLAIPLTPLQIFLPFIISRLLSGTNPFKFYNFSIILRLLVIGLSALWVYFTPLFQNTDKTYPVFYYSITLVIQALHSVVMYASYLPMMYFFTKISDKTFGATYMTLLNTISNLTRSSVNTSALYVANFLTFKECSYEADKLIHLDNSTSLAEILDKLNHNKCYSDIESKNCVKYGGYCSAYFDAYYLLTIICTTFGILWLMFFRKKLNELEALPSKDWKVYVSKIKLKPN